jgi:hypothetical protein
MQDASPRSFSDRLRDLTAELRRIDHDLKSNPSLDGSALREFRHALDNLRTTAWTVHELLNAQQTRKDPQTVISFLTAERLRRFRQMVRDLYSDLENAKTPLPAHDLRDLALALTRLRDRLEAIHRAS